MTVRRAPGTASSPKTTGGASATRRSSVRTPLRRRAASTAAAFFSMLGLSLATLGSASRAASSSTIAASWADRQARTRSRTAPASSPLAAKSGRAPARKTAAERRALTDLPPLTAPAFPAAGDERDGREQNERQADDPGDLVGRGGLTEKRRRGPPSEGESAEEDPRADVVLEQTEGDRRQHRQRKRRHQQPGREFRRGMD